MKGSIINFDYQSEELIEIRRNLETLYGTVEGTCPLDRSFGINQDFVGYPDPVTENMLALEMIQKTHKYEPRVMVKSVEFANSGDGSMTPVVTLTKGGE